MHDVIGSLSTRNNVGSPHRYRELLQNITWLNTKFTLSALEPKNTGECGINVTVKQSVTASCLILTQRHSRFSESFVDSLIGAVVVDLTSGGVRFAVQENQSNWEDSSSTYLEQSRPTLTVSRSLELDRILL